MRKGSLNEEYLDKLNEYGIGSPEQEVCFCASYKAGETIFLEGMPIPHLLIVLSGKAKVCLDAKNGKNLVLCYYVSKGLLGDIELMTDSPVATTSVIALTDFECIALPIQDLSLKLKDNPTFLKKLGTELASKLLRSSKNYLVNALHSGEERLCTYILETSYEGRFNDTLTDVSSSIGMSYRHMFRLLNQLCSDGALVKKDDGYHIIDRQALIKRSTWT